MRTVAIIGLGTIGSSVASLVARMPHVSAVTLVDPDSYDTSNLATQAIDISALGRPKVEVQTGLLKAINPLLEVEAFADRIENVPLAFLRNSILLSCVDNRRARQTINRIAWRCDSPWIDAAVGTETLVRISVCAPGDAAPCLECSWDEKSYDLLEQEYPCSVENETAPATGAPAQLGALAASLQVTELQKLISDRNADGSLVAAQLMFDTATHVIHLGHFTRDEKCRFDHQRWVIESVDLDPLENSLADLFASTCARSDQAISVEGHSFATFLDCVKCGKRSHVGLSLYRRLSDGARTCDCGGRMFALGFFSSESISQDELSTQKLSARLSTLGIRTGDVISVTDASGDARHLEITRGQHND